MGNVFKACTSNQNTEQNSQALFADAAEIALDPNASSDADSIDREIRQTAVIVAGLIGNGQSICKQSETEKKLDHKQRAIIICNHWFRMHTKKQSISTKDINSIIIKYYNNSTPYFGKFIQRNCGNGIAVINDSEIAFRSDVSLGNSYKSAKLDTPICMSSKVVFAWRIKMWNKLNLSMYDAFGVVSDECNNIGRAPWGGLTDFYGISAAGRKVWNGTTFQFNEDANHSTVIEKGQTVCIELDCELSRIVWKSEGQIIYGPVDLPPRNAWYPAITVGFPTWNYNVILLNSLL